MMRFIGTLVIVVSSIILLSCEARYDENVELNTDFVNNTIYETMLDIYLWYEEIPDIDPALYNSPFTLMDDLRSDKDIWSFVMEKTEFENYFTNAITAAHGFIVGSNTEDEIYIIMVLPNTPASKAGFKRGYKIETINGKKATGSNFSTLIEDDTPGISNTFKLITPQKETITKTINKEIININPVIYEDIIETSNGNTGYLVFQEFIDTASYYLEKTFKRFEKNQINNLIIDLRYNGGGVTNIAELMANYILGKKKDGDLMYYNNHNDQNQDLNNMFFFNEQNISLNLNHLYFITTENTASASELLINNLKPWMPVTIIGSRTHGKPVGMYVYSFTKFEYVFAPVSFESLNSLNEGRYYNGLEADYEVTDNVLYDFGDLNEPCLNAAYQLITAENYQGHKLKQSTVSIDKIYTHEPFFNNSIIKIEK